MKSFRKKRTSLPRPGAIERFIRRYGSSSEQRKFRAFLQSQTFPQEIMQVCLAEMDPNKRGHVRYFPDWKNFVIHPVGNRSVPVEKFLNMFRGMINQPTLDEIQTSLTDFKVKFLREPNEWLNAYADCSHVESCMTGDPEVACYAHPENDLALAVLYGPGSNQVIGRTIVNLAEKWYVRLFGDVMLVEKLMQAGYNKVQARPRQFKMYGLVGPRYMPGVTAMVLPYFDFPGRVTHTFHETHNPSTGMVEVLIN